LWEGTKPPLTIPFFPFTSPFIGKSLADAAAFLQNAPENEDWEEMHQGYFAFLNHEFETTDPAKVCQLGDGDGEGDGAVSRTDQIGGYRYVSWGPGRFLAISRAAQQLERERETCWVELGIEHG